MRWLILALALAALAALTAYGLRRPYPPLPSIRDVRSAPETWVGRDIVFESMRVAEVLPGGAFAVGSGGSRVVFRGAPEVYAGEDLTVRVTYDPGSGEFTIKAARSLPRGLTVYRGIILVVSVVVLLAVALNVCRRFRWEGGFAWRTS